MKNLIRSLVLFAALFALALLPSCSGDAPTDVVQPPAANPAAAPAAESATDQFVVTIVKPTSPEEPFGYRVGESVLERHDFFEALRRRAQVDLDASGISNVHVLVEAPRDTPYAAVLHALINCVNARLTRIAVSESGTASGSPALEIPLPVDDSLGGRPLPDEMRAAVTAVVVDVGETTGECQLTYQDRPVGDFEELVMQVRETLDTEEKRSTVPVNVFGADDVHWHWVHRALHVLRSAGCKQLRFGVGENNDAGNPRRDRR